MASLRPAEVTFSSYLGHQACFAMSFNTSKLCVAQAEHWCSQACKACRLLVHHARLTFRVVVHQQESNGLRLVLRMSAHEVPFQVYMHMGLSSMLQGQESN